MFDFLLLGAFAPFTIALALLFGLLALELIFALAGGSLLGGGDELDIDIDMPVAEMPDLGDLDLEIDFDGTDFEAGDFDIGGSESGPAAPAPGGVSSWLGLGRVPALIWLAAFLMGFGLTGTAVQMGAGGLLGRHLPALLAAVPAMIAGLWFARAFGGLFARLLPKSESEALSERHLGRSRGTVTQGTAARGRPAEVRVTDRYGNTHHIRAEPLRDDAILPQGTEVAVLRARLDGRYLLVGLSD